MSDFRPPGECPICGEDVPARAKAFPDCGADELSGWREGAEHDLPGEGDRFDYDKFLADEFGHAEKRTLLQRFWWVIAVVVLLAWLWSTFGRMGAAMEMSRSL